MRACIKSVDELAWKSMMTGWSPPTKKDELGNNVHRSELEWSTKEDKLPSSNWKALNAIFKGVSPMQFKSISVTESAKEALDILRIEVVGTSIVRKSRI